MYWHVFKVWLGTGETLPHTNKGKEETYKPKGEIAYCGKGVGGVHGTSDYADSKTAYTVIR